MGLWISKNAGIQNATRAVANCIPLWSIIVSQKQGVRRTSPIKDIKKYKYSSRETAVNSVDKLIKVYKKSACIMD